MNNIIDINEKILREYYESDVWDLTKHPVTEIAENHKKKLIKYRTLNFNQIKSEQKKQELKAYFKFIYSGKCNISPNSSRIIRYYYLIPFANTFPENSFLDLDKQILCELFESYISDIYTFSSEFLKIVSTLQEYISEAIDERIGFERDIWHLDSFKISPERFNKASMIRTLSFVNIINVANREYVKLYIKYLIGCTELAMSTIMNITSKLIIFFNEFKDINASDITTYELTEYIDDIKDLYSANYVNQIVRNIDNFYKYFEVREESNIKSPIIPAHYQKDNYIPSDNLVSEHVVFQIFKNLHTLPLQERVMFLINYTQGVRISDLCQIKSKDCISIENKRHYLHFYCQKMQKPLRVWIAPSLYKLIEEQRETIENSIYLFPSSVNSSNPISKCAYANRINNWATYCNIKNDDGTPYRYRSHAFRHTLATDLYQNYKVDLPIIQLAILGHQQIQMSLTYAQRGDAFNKALHDKYINNYGEFKSIEFENVDGLNKKALGNGYCGYPSSLGVCPYSDVCLNCEFFRTSKRFLDIHKKHLEEVRKNIIMYEENGYTNNLATAKNDEKTLLTIIESLEKL